MLAHMHGQLWNASKIAGSLGVTSPTIRRYLDMLCDTFMVRALPPYHANLRKRLIKTPKIHLRDPGILHALLGLDSLEFTKDRDSYDMAYQSIKWAVLRVERGSGR